MDERGVRYRPIDSGQHASLNADLRRELRIRPPDVLLAGAENVASIPQALAWAARVAGRCPSLGSPRPTMTPSRCPEERRALRRDPLVAVRAIALGMWGPAAVNPAPQ